MKDVHSVECLSVIRTHSHACTYISARARAHVFASVQMYVRSRHMCMCRINAPSGFFIYGETCKRVHVCVSHLSMCVWFCACIREYSVRFCFPFTILIKTLFVRIAVQLNRKKQDLFHTHTHTQRKTNADTLKNK